MGNSDPLDASPEGVADPLEPEADLATVTRQIALGDRPPESAATAGSVDPSLGVHPSLGTSSHAEVLRGEEVARCRGWAATMILLGVSALAFTPLLPLTTSMQALFAVTLIAVVISVPTWVLVQTRTEEGYTPGLFRVFGWSSAAGSVSIVYCLGVFSPTPVVITLGIYFFGQGLDRRYALIIPVFAIVGYVALALAILAGAIEDRGVFTAAGVPVLTQTFFVVMAPMVLAVTLWMARLSRRSVEDAVARATRAIQLAREREAQLAEARQDLELALRAGAGQGGRYTGVLAGRYEVGAVIGRGAMGEVYAANDPLTGDRAAVKVLRSDIDVRQHTFNRFLREGQVAGGLDVPNVVRIFGADAFADGTPYISMELLTGEDLAAVLRQRRVLKPRELIDLVGQVARGLTAAHAAGIVHRDLKPQNLFCHRASEGDRGTWKILDFGISKIVGSQGTLTQANIIGTPGYMAPEQARGLHTDQRADVFSLGAVLYRAATGRPPFSGPDMPQILFNVVYLMPLRPSSLVTKLPADLDLVLALALAKNPHDRLSDAGALASACEAALEHRLPGNLRARAEALIARFAWGTQGRAQADAAIEAATID